MVPTVLLALASQLVPFRLPITAPAWGGMFPEFSGYRGIEAIAFDGSRLYIAGNFHEIDRNRFDRIAAWDGAHWIALGTGIEDGLVHAIAIHDSMLYVAGNFTRAGGREVNSIARWNGVTWEDLGGGLTQPYKPDPDAGGTVSYEPAPHPDGTAAGRVYAITFLNNDLIAAGYFTHAGGSPAYCIARWDGARWHALGTNSLDGSMHIGALAVYQGRIVAGGNFKRLGGTDADCIAQWDGSRWSRFGTERFHSSREDDWGPRYRNARITSLAVDGSNLYAAGIFHRIDKLKTGSVARWDGVTWRALGDDAPAGELPPSETILPSVATLGPNVFVASQTGGLFRFDGVSWHAEFGSSPPAHDAGDSPSVLGLTVTRGLLFAFGHMANDRNVAVFDGARWWPSSTPTMRESLRSFGRDLQEEFRPYAPPVKWTGVILLGWLALAVVFQGLLRCYHGTPAATAPVRTANRNQHP